jgi:hypothetical protein
MAKLDTTLTTSTSEEVDPVVKSNGLKLVCYVLVRIFYKSQWIELELVTLFPRITPRTRYSPSRQQIIQRCD